MSCVPVAVDEQPAVIEPRFGHHNRGEGIGDAPRRDVVLAPMS
jgi:hypothetical protein